LDYDLLTVAGVLGAALLGALGMAVQRNWARADNPAVLAACAIGACLAALSLFTQWNTPLCLLAIVLVGTSVVGLGQAMFRQHRDLLDR